MGFLIVLIGPRREERKWKKRDIRGLCVQGVGNRARRWDKTKMERNQQRYTTMGDNQIEDVRKKRRQSENKQRTSAGVRQRETADRRRLTNGERVEGRI